MKKRLLKIGFELLHESTQTYGKNGVTGSIYRVNESGSIRLPTDKDYDKTKEVFIFFQDFNNGTKVTCTTKREIEQRLKIIPRIFKTIDLSRL